MKQSETPLTHKRCLKLRVISIVFRRHSKCPIGIFSSKIFSYKVYVDKYLYVYSSQKCKCKKKVCWFSETRICVIVVCCTNGCDLCHLPLQYHHPIVTTAAPIWLWSFQFTKIWEKRWDRFQNITWYCQSLSIILGLR